MMATATASSNIILIHTNYDEETVIIGGWASELTSIVSADRILRGNEVNAAALRALIAGLQNSSVIAFYGHGTEEELLEYLADKPESNRALVGTKGECVQPEELSKHKIYAVACWAGSRLGRALSQSGAEFIGYQYAFWLAPGFNHRLKEIVNAGLIAWLRGARGPDVVAQLKEGWKSLSIQKRSPKASVHISDELFVAMVAHWNGDSLVYHGP
jgi:hypothetical protein